MAPILVMEAHSGRSGQLLRRSLPACARKSPNDAFNEDVTGCKVMTAATQDFLACVSLGSLGLLPV